MGTRERIEVALQEIGIPRNIAGLLFGRCNRDVCESGKWYASSTGEVVYPAIAEKYGVTKMALSVVFIQQLLVQWPHQR